MQGYLAKPFCTCILRTFKMELGRPELFVPSRPLGTRPFHRTDVANPQSGCSISATAPILYSIPRKSVASPGDPSFSALPCSPVPRSCSIVSSSEHLTAETHPITRQVDRFATQCALRSLKMKSFPNGYRVSLIPPAWKDKRRRPPPFRRVN